jgi:ribosomal protein S18 acetylase RimI-like enzyme
MIKATVKDKELVINMLSRAFENNKSVNYIAGNSCKQIERLMRYAFEKCFLFGGVLLNEDKSACLLYIDSTRKQVSLPSVFLDLKLVLAVIGLWSIKKVISREKTISQYYPSDPYLYIWFIGVEPTKQGKGHGSHLLYDFITLSKYQGKPVYLETSTVRNVSWYKRLGFEVYAAVELSYKLYFLRHS